MNSFQNLPSQLTALLLGWAFTLYLSHRANVRSETLKRKDKLVDRLEKLSEWVEGEVDKETFEPSTTEAAYAAMVSQIEIRLSQINQLSGTEVFAAEELAVLRDVDFFVGNVQKLHYEIRDRASDIVEQIEIAFNRLYFEQRGIILRLQSALPELHGIIAALLGLSLIALLAKSVASM